MDVVLYLRLSLDRDGKGLGVARQEEACRALAAEKGWNITSVYTDNDISATTGKKRPGFEQLLADKPADVLVWHIDRMVRVSRDLERVLDLGLTVHAVTAGSVDLSTPTGRAMARTVTAWATYEGEHKAERMRAQAYQRAQMGRPLWSRRPFGFNPNGTLCTVEADAIRQAYTDVLAGVARHEIARQWNKAGIKPSNNPDGKFSSSKVSFILRAARNAGIRTYRGSEIAPGNWTPIVSREVWDGVQAILDHSAATRPMGRVAVGLLSGIGRCGVCNALLRGHAKGTYACTNGCISCIPREVVDAYAWGQVTMRLLPERQDLWGTDPTAERTSLTARIAITRGKQTRAAELWSDDLISDEQLAVTSRRLKDELASLQSQLEALPPAFQPVLTIAAADGSPTPYVTAEAVHWPPTDLSLAQCRELVRKLGADVKVHKRGKGNRGFDPFKLVEVA